MEPGPSHKREHYTEYLLRLDSACEWLDIGRGRAVQYKSLVREFNEGKQSREHILAYNESCEIVDLYELWQEHVDNFPGLKQKIRSAFRKGPILREDEKPKASSNRARNDAFGYLVAGKLLAARIPVVALEGINARDATCESQADLTFRWCGRLIDTQCKRPQSHGALGKRTKEALRQLGDLSRCGRDGMIAIDCSVLVRPPGNLLESNSAEEAEQIVSNMLENDVVPKVRSHLGSSIFGLLLFARVPGMTRLQEWRILTSQGKPIQEFRPESISSWLAVGNSEHPGSKVLQSLAARLQAASGGV